MGTRRAGEHETGGPSAERHRAEGGEVLEGGGGGEAGVGGEAGDGAEAAGSEGGSGTAGRLLDERYDVHLGVYDGPLDLLLHLVRTHEVEVRQLPLAPITGEYLEMLRFMTEIDLEPASEFLELAAALVRLKAQALLPGPSAAGDAEALAAEEEALLEQLVEHQVTRMAADHLRSRERRAAAVWFRGEKKPGGVESKETEIVEADLFALVSAFKELLADLEAPPSLALGRDRFPVAERVDVIRSRLAGGTPLEFVDLFERRVPRAKLIATFLALLELIRGGEVRALQERRFGTILVFPAGILEAGEGQAAPREEQQSR